MKDESKELCFECNFCDFKCASVSKLQSHMRTCHMRNFSSQTQETIMVDKKMETDLIRDKQIGQVYETHQCFYCEKEIVSKKELVEHIVTCHGASETPSLFSLPVRPRAVLFKCAICGLVESFEADILNHKKRVHGSQ